MGFKSVSAALALGAVLAGNCTFVVFAQDAAVPDGQRPPAVQQAPADQPPPEKPKCVTTNTDFKTKGKAATFEIELVNSCNKRLKCIVDAFVIGARGQAQGHGTLILPPASNGQTASKTYAMKVKSAGGMANVSSSCKAI